MDLPYRLPSQCPLRSPFSRQPRARHHVPYTRAGRLRNPQARCVDCHGRKGRKINGWAQRLPLSKSQRRDGPWAQMTKTKTQEGEPRDRPVVGGFNMADTAVPVVLVKKRQDGRHGVMGYPGEKTKTQEGEPRARSVAESLKMEGAAERGLLKPLRNGRGTRGWPCGVSERVFRIGPIRHYISNRAIYFYMPTCRHADMPTCRITE